jgi:hypothetical protein
MQWSLHSTHVARELNKNWAYDALRSRAPEEWWWYGAFGLVSRGADVRGTAQELQSPRGDAVPAIEFVLLGSADCCLCCT